MCNQEGQETPSGTAPDPHQPREGPGGIHVQTLPSSPYLPFVFPYTYLPTTLCPQKLQFPFLSCPFFREYIALLLRCKRSPSSTHPFELPLGPPVWMQEAHVNELLFAFSCESASCYSKLQAPVNGPEVGRGNDVFSPLPYHQENWAKSRQNLSVLFLTTVCGSTLISK